jgi:glycerol-3-phosphate responsive antiterminator
MNNGLENKEIAKDIVNKLVKAVEQSSMLQNYINTAKEDAIKKTVRFFARDVVSTECGSDDIDTNELAKALGVSFETFDGWEAGVTRKVSDMACEELRNRIHTPVISESLVQDHVGKPKYQILLG